MKRKQQKLELNVQKREVLGRKVKSLRQAGYIPAVLYGKSQESLLLQIPAKDFQKVFKEAGESTLVYINVGPALQQTDASGNENRLLSDRASGQQTYPTIIHDVARNPLTGDIIHADFYKVRLDEKIKAKAPVVFEGESPAVKELGGIFVRNINELEVEAFPQDLPHEININISSLKQFGDQIFVKDLDLGTNVRILAEDNTILALVQEPLSEEELKAQLETPSAGVEEVEVIKKEKEEETAPEAGTAPEKEKEKAAPQ